MDRLTYEKSRSVWDRGKHPSKYTSRHTFQEVVARLAAYEDTGLEPEDVTDLMAAHGMAIEKLAEYRMREEKRAPKCYSPDTERCYSPYAGVGCRYMVPDGDDEPIDRCKKCPLCYADKQCHRSEPNASLTLEELREMDGEPVYIIEGTYSYYALISGVLDRVVWLISRWDEREVLTDDYGKTWLAYRRKPEGVMP